MVANQQVVGHAPEGSRHGRDPLDRDQGLAAIKLHITQVNPQCLARERSTQRWRNRGISGPVSPLLLPRQARACSDDEQAANPALWAAIGNALGALHWFILLASADAAQSVWVNREVQWWLTQAPGWPDLACMATLNVAHYCVPMHSITPDRRACPKGR